MDDYKKYGISINVLFLVLISVAANVFLFTSASPYITKTVASVLFVLCGIFNYFYCRKHFEGKFNKKFALFMLLGLIFSMIGDIFLIKFFIVGAIFFAIGHILYFIAFCFAERFKWYDILVGLVVYAGTIILIQVIPFQFNGMKPLILGYAFIISFMVGKAIANQFTSQSMISSIYTIIGAFLFFFSDTMLVFYNFGTGEVEYDIWCVITYYIGQFFLSSSIFVSSLFYQERDED